MKKILLILVFASIFSVSKAQFDDIFGSPLMGLDTIYYPFYDDVQMIEIDLIGEWDRMIYMLEQSQPRAMPHSYFHPQPLGNIYIFRHKNGDIVKAYNTIVSVDSLTEQFKKIPVQTSSKFDLLLDNVNDEGIWAYSPQRMFNFDGWYLVNNSVSQQLNSSLFTEINYSDTTIEKTQFGLIDRKGNLILGMEYDAILPLSNVLLVCKDLKWGIMDRQMNIIVDFAYDSYENYYANDEYDKILYLLNDGKKSAVYDVKKQTVKSLGDYDKIYYDGNTNGYDIIPVIKNEKMGFVDKDYNVLSDPIYDICEYNPNSTYLLTSSNGKFGYMNSDLSFPIPLQYDYAEAFGRDSIALVLKDGEFFCIDKMNNRVDSVHRTPSWKLYQDNALPSYCSMIHIESQNKYRFGMFDNRDFSVIIPIGSRNFPLKSIGDDRKRIFTLQKEKYGKFALIDLQTMEQTDYVYDRVQGIYHDVIIASKDEKYGVLDTNFNVIIDFKYEYLSYKLNNANMLVYRENNLYGYMDFQENIVVEAQYMTISSYTLYDVVRTEEGLGVVDKDGKLFADCIYQDINTQNLDELLLRVKKDGKYGIINKKGRYVLKCEYDKIYNSRVSKGGKVKVEKNGQTFEVRI